MILANMWRKHVLPVNIKLPCASILSVSLRGAERSWFSVVAYSKKYAKTSVAYLFLLRNDVLCLVLSHAPHSGRRRIPRGCSGRQRRSAQRRSRWALERLRRIAPRLGFWTFPTPVFSKRVEQCECSTGTYTAGRIAGLQTRVSVPLQQRPAFISPSLSVIWTVLGALRFRRSDLGVIR